MARVTDPATKPILLYAMGTSRPDNWTRALATLDDFVTIEAHGLPAATALTQACRPDLLLLGPDLRHALPSEAGARWSLIPLRFLPLVVVDRVDSLSRHDACSFVDDILPPDLSTDDAAVRLRAVLRRERPTALTSRILWKGVELRHDERRVLVRGEPVHLSFREFNLLALLLERPGRIWPRDVLSAAIWGPRAQVGAPALNILAQKLRRHLGPHLGYDGVEAIRGVGYRLV